MNKSHVLSDLLPNKIRPIDISIHIDNTLEYIQL